MKLECKDYRDEEIMVDMLNGNIARIRMSDSQKEIDKMVEYAKARIEAQIYGAAIWKKRNKEEENGVYYIRRPSPWTPIPEETL